MAFTIGDELDGGSGQADQECRVGAMNAPQAWLQMSKLASTVVPLMAT